MNTPAGLTGSSFRENLELKKALNFPRGRPVVSSVPRETPLSCVSGAKGLNPFPDNASYNGTAPLVRIIDDCCLHSVSFYDPSIFPIIYRLSLALLKSTQLPGIYQGFGAVVGQNQN